MAEIVYARHGIGTSSVDFDGAIPRKLRKPRVCGSCLAAIEPGEVCVERLAGGRTFCVSCIRLDSTHHLTGGVEIVFGIPDTGPLPS